MKKLIRKLLCVLSLVAVIGVNTFAQSNFTAKSACAGDPVEFTVNIDQSKVGTPNLVWTWGDNVNDPKDAQTLVVNHTYNIGGTYAVTLVITYTGAGASPAETISKVVEAYSRPNASYYYGPETAACVGETVTLKVNAYGNYVLWSNGKTTEQITVPEAKAGKYKAVIYNDNLCTAPEQLDNNGNVLGETVVSFYHSPEISADGLTDLEYNKTTDKDMLGLPVTVWVNGAVDYPTSPVVLKWDPNQTVKSDGSWDKFRLTPERSMTYTLTATQTHTAQPQDVICTAQRLVTVDVIVIRGNESTPFAANNVFMPGSARNQYWMMATDNELSWYKNCKLIIYNTWGQEVFVADKIENLPGYADGEIWDGKSNDGEELPNDTYYYLVKCSNCGCEPNPQANEHAGAVSIIRK